jgi:predicted transcriptional regulator
MACVEIMTGSVVRCVPEDAIEHAAALMETEDASPMPVIESCPAEGPLASPPIATWWCNG